MPYPYSIPILRVESQKNGSLYIIDVNKVVHYVTYNSAREVPFVKEGTIAKQTQVIEELNLFLSADGEIFNKKGKLQSNYKYLDILLQGTRIFTIDSFQLDTT